MARGAVKNGFYFFAALFLSTVAGPSSLIDLPRCESCSGRVSSSQRSGFYYSFYISCNLLSSLYASPHAPQEKGVLFKVTEEI